MTDELRWQFDLAWALADLHLSALVEDDFLWQPAPLCRTVRPDASTPKLREIAHRREIAICPQFRCTLAVYVLASI